MIIRSYSFCSKGTPFYLQCSKRGILDLLSTEFFGSFFTRRKYLSNLYEGKIFHG